MQPFAKWIVPFLFAGTVMGSTPLTLREKVQSVTSSVHQHERGPELAEKDSVTASRCLRTGSDSRAQFDFVNGLIRLGAASELQLEPAANRMTLQKGTVLFERLLRGHRLTVQVNNLEVVVTGDAGFAQLVREQESDDSTLCVGAIAGETVVRLNGQSYPLQAAELFVIKSGGKVLLGNFNLPKMVQNLH